MPLKGHHKFGGKANLVGRESSNQRLFDELEHEGEEVRPQVYQKKQSVREIELAPYSYEGDESTKVEKNSKNMRSREEVEQYTTTPNNTKVETK